MKMRGLAIAATSVLLTGCTLAPSLNVLGAYFPDWMFCIVAGVSLTVVVHVIQSRWKLEPWLAPLPLTYSALTTLFSLAVWLMFFQN